MSSSSATTVVSSHRMPAATTFVSTPITVLSASSFISRSSCRHRSPAKRPKWRREAPSMLAKFQKQESNVEQPDGESQLEKLVPSELPLPTLSTLTGVGVPEPNSRSVEGNGTEDDIDLSQISTMGVGLSQKEENSAIDFLKGVIEELKLVEWPSASRVIRLTALIIATIIVAVIALYFIDGFFYRVSHVLFEGKI